MNSIDSPRSPYTEAYLYEKESDGYLIGIRNLHFTNSQTLANNLQLIVPIGKEGSINI